MRYVRAGSDAWEAVFARPGPGLRRAARLYQGFASKQWNSLRCREFPQTTASLLVLFGGSLSVGCGAGTSASASASAGARADGGAGDVVESGSTDGEPGMRFLVAGPHTGTYVVGSGDWLHGLHVDLAPWAVYGMLGGAPMHLLADRVLELGELAPDLALDLARRLGASTGWEERFGALDDVLTARLRAGMPAAPYVVHGWREINRTAGRRPIASLADEAGVCRRHLQAMFREQIGLPAKACAKVVRIRHALRLLATGRPVADVALECDFYDQSHFSRVFKSMTGFSPSESRQGRAERAGLAGATTS